jgi:2-oxo-4-hydroxy-4-carboxy-5-ureidoimidazoline decarboxylase
MQTPSPILAAWNALDADTAAAVILPCNGSPNWAAKLTALRPFQTNYDLTCTADVVWRGLTPADWQQAFDSHPRIGEQHAAASTPQSLAWSRAEQSTPLSDPQLDIVTLGQLALANQRYEEKFHRIFIICATGKSTANILAILQQRLANDPRTELLEAAEQQRRITQLRLRKWLATS